MPFPDLADRVHHVQDRLRAAQARGGHAQAVTLIAVTKTHGADAVTAAVRAGLTDVGENKVQEALDKMAQVTVPVRWHLIGHLQRNKVKFLEPFALIHSVDSPRLADEIDKFGRKLGRVFDVLVQVNVSGEDTKGGFSPAEVEREADRLRACTGIRVRGTMTMAPYGADEATLRAVFAGARAARERLRASGHEAPELSMGMSEDYEIAVEEGATMVRLGTVLFGTRVVA
jgi:pyridoxal phosphate enzyme (YggS family)